MTEGLFYSGLTALGPTAACLSKSLNCGSIQKVITFQYGVDFKPDTAGRTVSTLFI